MLDASLKQQLDGILNDHRTRKRRGKLAPGSKHSYSFALGQLCRYLMAIDPGRDLTALSAFTADDLQAYQKYLESPHDGRKFKPASIKTMLMPFKTIFPAAQRKGVVQEDASVKLDLDWVSESEEGKRLSPDEVERLCREKSDQDLSLRDRFLHLRNLAMIRVQKDAALRPGEVIRLCLGDVFWNKTHPNGVVPIVIQEGKRREAGVKDPAYLTSWSTGILKRFLAVREEFRKATGISTKPALSQWDLRILGDPIFFSGRGTHMTISNYELMFRGACADAGLDGYTPHDLRHTQISEWADAGFNPVWTQKLARHADVSTTLRKYYHIIQTDLIKGLGKLNGSEPEKAPPDKVSSELLPQKEVRRVFFRHALEQAGQPTDETTLDRMDHALTEGKDKMADLYFTVQETCARLKIERTQLYMGWKEAGHLTALKVGQRTVFLKTEVEAIVSLRTTEEASKILGYREKRPTSILRYVDQGLLRAVKIGKTYRFRDTDLVNFLRDKNSGRLRFEVKCREKKTAEGDNGNV